MLTLRKLIVPCSMMIEQPARRGDDHIHALLQFVLLFAVADAAVNHRDTQVGETPVIAKSRLHLRGQFARRFEDEATKRAVLRQERQDWQRKSGRFAGAGLRGADEIFAGEDEREKRAAGSASGSMKPIAWVPCTTSSERPRLRNDTRNVRRGSQPNAKFLTRFRQPGRSRAQRRMRISSSMFRVIFRLLHFRFAIVCSAAGWGRVLRSRSFDASPAATMPKPIRVLVIADTHNHLPPKLEQLADGVDEIWHLGDVCVPSLLDELIALGPPVTVVRGNCDSETGWPLVRDLKRNGVSCRLVHIPPPQWPENTDVLLHGHTHVPRNERIAGVLFLNPGCVTRPNRGAAASVAYLEIATDGKISWRLKPIR